MGWNQLERIGLGSSVRLYAFGQLTRVQPSGYGTGCRPQ